MTYEQPNSNEYRYDVTVTTIGGNEYKFMSNGYGVWGEDRVTWSDTNEGRIIITIGRIECFMMKENMR